MEKLKPLSVKTSGSQKYLRLLAGKPSTAGMKSGYVILKPGEAVGDHVTEAREEAVLVLEGEASVYIDGVFAFCAGQETLVYVPPETRHDIKNNGAGTLRYVYIVTPVNS